jgi:Trypsin
MRFEETFVILLAICCIFVEGHEYCGRKFDGSGKEVRSNEWPWLVALVNWPKNSFFCGGSLISSKHVISGEIC